MGLNLTTIKAYINGVRVDLPEDWQSIQVVANFGEDVQPAIETEDFTFVGSACDEIVKHIQLGYYFEGLPFRMEVQNGNDVRSVFDGYIDLTDSYEKLSTDRIKVKVKVKGGVDDLATKLSSFTYGYLDSLGVITSVDVEYVIEKKNNVVEIVMTSVAIYLMTKEIAESIERISTNINNVQALFTTSASGVPPSPPLGAILLASLQLLVEIAYTAVLLVAIVKMATDLIQGFVSLVRKYKACSFYELLSSACEYLGYQFSSTISDLSNIHFLPSDPFNDKIESGVPRPNDAGYNCGDFFAICQRMFSARTVVLDNVVHFENLDSTFWVKQSSFKMPSVFKDVERKNGSDLVGTRIISFTTDVADEWTIENIKGTYYDVRTLQTDYRNGFDYLNIKNIDDRIIPFALGNRKDQLNILEESIKTFASLVDTITGLFGGGTNFASSIQDRVGMLKFSANNHSVPKCLYLVNGKLPANNRDLFSAKALYDRYIKAESFVLSENGGQKLIFEGVRIPFGFDDFTRLIKNSYFTDDNGNLGKVTNVNWTVDGDYAEVNYWIKDPEATDKLIEQYIEPS